jgi:hypothetical protein
MNGSIANGGLRRRLLLRGLLGVEPEASAPGGTQYNQHQETDDDRLDGKGFLLFPVFLLFLLFLFLFRCHESSRRALYYSFSCPAS